MPTVSVTFDSTEIVTTTYVPKTLKHESTPLRELTLVDLAKEDGAVLVSEKYGIKRIIITGNIKASTRTGLENAIDDFKELFSRTEKDLDIDWAGVTRRYVATCVRHEFNRDFMHINFVPWFAEFVVASGIGINPTITAAINAVTINAIIWTQADTALSFAGSAEPKPIITLTYSGAWSGKDNQGIEIKNTDTDARIIFTNPNVFANGDILIFDWRTRIVTLNGVEQVWYGVFPSFLIGSVNYRILQGNITDQAFEDITSITGVGVYDNHAQAESFTVPYTDTTYMGATFYIKKTGAPAAVMACAIWGSDADGLPDSGNVIATFANIPAGSVGASYAFVGTNSAAVFTLTAGVKYWLVASSVGSTVGNHYIWGAASGIYATYKRGNRGWSNNFDVAATWVDVNNDDMLFRILYGGDGDIDNITFDVDYYKRYL